MEEQVCVIWAGTNGYLDPMPMAKVKEFETTYARAISGTRTSRILNDIRDTKDLSDGAELQNYQKKDCIVETLAKPELRLTALTRRRRGPTRVLSS